MKQLKNLLGMKKSIPVVIYIHCEAGKDRTGEISGSYYMKYLNWEFNQALWYDNHCVEGTRDISTESKNGLQWYCYYLKYVEKRKISCSVDENYKGHC